MHVLMKIYYENYILLHTLLLFYDNLKLGNNNNKKIKYIHISETNVQYATVT